jgi:hypothetical protein
MAQKEHMFLKWVVVWRVKVSDLPTQPENSTEGSVLVAMQQWNVEHRVFAIEQFFLEIIENKQSYNYLKNMRSFRAILYINSVQSAKSYVCDTPMSSVYYCHASYHAITVVDTECHSKNCPAVDYSYPTGIQS